MEHTDGFIQCGNHNTAQFCACFVIRHIFIGVGNGMSPAQPAFVFMRESCQILQQVHRPPEGIVICFSFRRFRQLPFRRQQGDEFCPLQHLIIGIKFIRQLHRQCAHTNGIKHMEVLFCRRFQNMNIYLQVIVQFIKENPFCASGEAFVHMLLDFLTIRCGMDRTLFFILFGFLMAYHRCFFIL